MHIYLDDIFIYSNSVKEHKQHLKIIFDRLRKNSLYLKWSKCNLYAKEIDCLSHIIDDQGIHPDADKLASIWEWRTPQNYNDIQQFIGLGKLCREFPFPCHGIYWATTVYHTRWIPILLVANPPMLLQHDQAHMLQDTNHQAN